MTVATKRSKSKRSSGETGPSLSPEKGNEVLGVVFLVAGVLALLALGSHHPADPSLFHQTPEGTPIHNWIGQVGAELSALAFGLLGLTAFLLPALLLAFAWRRLRHHDGERVIGRGIGVLLLFASAPGLLQLALGRLGWH